MGDDAEFRTSSSEMPWLALPYRSEVKAELDARFDIQGVPRVVLLTRDGDIVNTDARTFITRDPKGERFPWADGDVDGPLRPLRPSTAEKVDDAVKHSWSSVCASWTWSLLCIWMPIIFFMGASNVPDTCEQNLGLWMRLFALLAIFLFPLMQCLIVILGKTQINLLYKLSLTIHIITNLVGLGLIIWGWIVWAGSSEEQCFDGTGVNPIVLSLIFLIFATFSSFLLCVMLVAVGVDQVKVASRRSPAQTIGRPSSTE